MIDWLRATTYHLLGDNLISLHRVHFDLENGIQIEIESVHGHGKPLNLRIDAICLVSADEEGDDELCSGGRVPPMCWREHGKLFEPFQLREDTDYFIDVTIPLSLEDSIQRSMEHSAWPLGRRLTSVFAREPTKRWRQLRVDGQLSTVITGQLRLRSHAGVLELGTEIGGSLRAEVVCRKIGYFDEFKRLLDGLAEKAAELLLTYDSPTSLSFSLSHHETNNGAGLHFLLRYVMSSNQLPLAISEVINNPHARLIERLEMKSIEEIEEGQADLIADHLDVSSIVYGGPLQRVFMGFTPRELPQLEVFESYDTPENRYAKAFLQHCQLLCHRLELGMNLLKRKAAEREARGWSLEIDDFLQHNLWKEVGPSGQVPANSQVMLFKRGYKELFRLDVALRMSLGLFWPEGVNLADGLMGDSRPVSQIYEYWCFFILREILQSLCVEKSEGNFITVSPDGLRIQLVKGRRSECRFEFLGCNGTRLNVSLFYNRKFSRPLAPSSNWSGSYTAAFDPDYSIFVRAPDGSFHWMHFDAKYRLEYQQASRMFDGAQGENGVSCGEGSSEYEEELIRVYKQDDLFKMHTYRDGILSTRGAYVLYPGDGYCEDGISPKPNVFVRHPTAFNGNNDALVPSVGAFPLTPEGTGDQTAVIRELLKVTFNNVCTAGKYIEESAWFDSSS